MRKEKQCKISIYSAGIIFLIAICLVLYYLVDISNQYIGITVFSVFTYFYLCHCLKRGGLEPLGCTGVVLLYLFLSEFGLCIVYSLFGRESITYNDRVLAFLYSDNFVKAIILANLAMLFYSFAAIRRVTVGIKRIKLSNIENEKVTRVVYWLGVAILVFSFLVMAILFMSGTINTKMDYTEYRSIVFDNVFYQYMIVLYSFGCCFSFASAEHNQLIFCGCLAGATALLLLITGNRGEVLYPALAVFGILKVRKIKIPKFYVICGVTIIIFITPFISGARHAGGWGAYLLSYSTNVLQSIIDTLAEIGIQIRLTVFVLDEFFAGSRHFLYGFSYYEFLPRWLSVLGFSYKIPVDFNFRTLYSTMGFNQIAESYANFGMMGVISFHYILGRFMGKREKIAKSSLDIAVLGACCSVFINMTRNKFSFVPTNLLFILMFYLFIRMLSKMKIS